MKPITLAVIILMLFESNMSFTQSGSLDNSFGTNGIIVNYIGFTGQSVATQKDGKILVCGTSGIDFELTRFNNNGSVDSGFGVNGIVTTNFKSSQVQPIGIAVQQDGKIVVAGSLQYWNGWATEFGFALARYKKDGSLDHSFGDKGKVLTTLNATDYIIASSVALQPDGKIIVVGNSISEYYSQPVTARYNADGSVDAGFHEQNYFSLYDLLNSVALQSDQKIIGTGYTSRNYSSYKIYFLLTRLKADFRIDSTFGQNGKNSNGRDTGIAVAVLKNDRIAVLTSNGSLKQFSKDGIADSLFGNNGKVSVPFETKTIAVTNNKIIVVGTKDGNFAVARYGSSGKLDKTFGIDGIAAADFGANDELDAVAIQRHDGKIITAGSSDNNKLAVARFNGDSQKDSVINNAVINDRSDASKQPLPINIYPNPFQSTLNIDLRSSGKTKKIISVYDRRGSLLFTTSAAEIVRLNLKSLIHGSYFIKINDGDGRELFSGKVIKQ